MQAANSTNIPPHTTTTGTMPPHLEAHAMPLGDTVMGILMLGDTDMGILILHPIQNVLTDLRSQEFLDERVWSGFT